MNDRDEKKSLLSATCLALQIHMPGYAFTIIAARKHPDDRTEAMTMTSDGADVPTMCDAMCTAIARLFYANGRPESYEKLIASTASAVRDNLAMLADSSGEDLDVKA